MAHDLGAARAPPFGVGREGVLPAARALRAGGVFDLDGKLAADGQLDLGDNEQVGERCGVLGFPLSLLALVCMTDFLYSL